MNARLVDAELVRERIRALPVAVERRAEVEARLDRLLADIRSS